MTRSTHSQNVLSVSSLSIILLLGSTSLAYGQSDSHNTKSVLIGPTYCASGQVTWCHNFTTAVECKAVKHCLQNLWLSQKPSTIFGSCGSCEAEIQKIRKNIGADTTKEELEELLEHICKLNFAKELFRKRCEKFIGQYIDSYSNELLDLLKSDIDPATVCHILGYCSGIKFSAPMSSDNPVIQRNSFHLYFPANFVSANHSKKLLGAEKCTWGLSYWCNNILTSRQCKSTSHCINNIWSKKQYPEDNDSICQICKDMVQQARDQLQSNKTQEELRELLNGSCNLIPIKEVRKDCIKLADKSVPELTEMLISEMNPTAICTLTGLCNSARIDNMLIESADSCTNCTAALSAVERYLQSAPQNHILYNLITLCDQLSTYSSACVNAVTSKFSQIYRILSTEIRSFPVCHLSGMCTSRYHQHSSASDITSRVNTMLAAANNDLPCDLCQQMVKHWKDVLTANTTETEFKQILDGICQHSGSFRKECLAIVDENFQKIYKFLTEELNSEEICQEMNLCPKKNLVFDENMHLINNFRLPPAFDSRLTLSSAKLGSAVECQSCKMIIKIIQKEMKKPEYKHDIKKLLAKVCSLVPRLERNKCNRFIQKYGDTLLKILTTQTNPDIVCHLLQLCPGVFIVRNFDSCPFCQRILHYIQAELDKPEEQRKLEDVVRKICKYMPKSKQEECRSFISDYASVIISLLSEELDPSLVCPVLKLCPRQLSADRCTQCQHLFGGLIAALGNDRTEQNVERTLATFVPAKPSNMTLTAVQLKVNHYEDIVDLMRVAFDAQESCVFLQFCDTAIISSATGGVSHSVGTNEISQPATTGRLTKPSCELCELVVQLYVEKLTSNITEKEIELGLLKFCNKIKNPHFRSNCTYFIEKYVPEVAKRLKQDATPQKLCNLLDLCPSKLANNMPANLEGSDRCEFCEAVVGYLEGFLTNSQMVAESVSSLVELCSVFDEPEDLGACVKIISQVGPQLESVTLSIPSWYYCSKVHMCPYGARTDYKEVKCYHHSQWCVDIRRAVLCDKLSYCKQMTWKFDKPSL